MDLQLIQVFDVTDSVTLSSTASVTFTPGAVNASHSSAVASSASVEIDGSTAVAITTTLRDVFDNVVSGKTVSLVSRRGVADTISPASVVSNASGVAIFSVSSYTAATSTYTVTDVTDSVVLTQTPTVEFLHGVAAQMAFSTEPSSSTASGTSFATQPVLTIKDAFGNVVTDGTESVVLTLTQGTGVLSGTVRTTPLAGVADFVGKGLKINLTGSDKVIEATYVTGLGSKYLLARTGALTITPAAAATLSIASVPSSTTAGSAFNIQVTALDSAGNVASGYTGTVLFTSSDSQAVLPSNYTFVGGDAGVHTFTSGGNLKTAASAASVTATDTVSGSITGSKSGILVSPNSATHLGFSTNPGNSTAGATVSPQPLIALLDAYENTVSTSTVISMAISNNPSSATLSGVTVSGTSAGVAEFTD